MNKVEEIIKNKRTIIENKKKNISTEDLKRKACDFKSTNSIKYEFQDKLKEDGCSLICEYKVASPSKGHISNLSLEEIIRIYDKCPVDAISILTENLYFNSNLKNLKNAKKFTSKPLLRKDFFIDEYMIYEAALNDASCVLLIEGITPDIEEYLNITYELGMDAIVECHSIEDLLNVEKYNPQIIGVNNRNLKDFTINLETTKELKEFIPNYMISESGVKNIRDAQTLKSYGADGVLIGSSILESNNKEVIESYLNDLNHVLK
ncbi:MAG: indole-3-glycerol-phosphate synthase TrpC [Methanosphaera sp. rholeuAM130]|nr:indole-3-glycerol-phosphate synthase [Methanosphaera sp.]RAP52224.1 MAG: indole-3-glycerol-phosphate synthase TrpC [Methanosphaera sp. rholeuAM130]